MNQKTVLVSGCFDVLYTGHSLWQRRHHDRMRKDIEGAFRVRVTS